MKKVLLILACGIAAQLSYAQATPKWAGKAKKAVFSIVTYIYMVRLTDAKQSHALGVKESSMLLGTGLKELSNNDPSSILSTSHNSSKRSDDLNRNQFDLYPS